MNSGRCSCDAPARPGQRTCHKCHAKYMRVWRKSHRLQGHARTRANARAYAHVYVKRGKVDRQPCMFCGELKAEISQPDPARPLQIVWCCAGCRRRVQREHAHTKALAAADVGLPVVAANAVVAPRPTA